MDNRQEAIEIVAQATDHCYPLRWVDGKTTLGDFDGRESSIDVFNIPFAEQRPFLRSVQSVRDRLKELVGSRCLFIFHSPEATREHYKHLIGPAI